MTRNPDRPSAPGKTALNQHLHRHHGGPKVRGNLQERLAMHDELHWWARKQGADLKHTHLPYQDGESDNEMAARYLAEGEAGFRAHQDGATAPVPPQE